MSDLLRTLGEILPLLGDLLREVLQLVLRWWLVLFWIAWWLCGVNWKKGWPFLARGAWVPLVLIVVVGALVWSRLYARDWALGGAAYVPNFWWQLVALSLLTGTALFCGWLQGVLGWTPSEVELEPVETEHGHEAGHGHH